MASAEPLFSHLEDGCTWLERSAAAGRVKMNWEKGGGHLLSTCSGCWLLAPPTSPVQHYCLPALLLSMEPKAQTWHGMARQLQRLGASILESGFASLPSCQDAQGLLVHMLSYM